MYLPPSLPPGLPVWGPWSLAPHPRPPRWPHSGAHTLSLYKKKKKNSFGFLGLFLLLGVVYLSLPWRPAQFRLFMGIWKDLFHEGKKLALRLNRGPQKGDVVASAPQTGELTPQWLLCPNHRPLSQPSRDGMAYLLRPTAPQGVDPTTA